MNNCAGRCDPKPTAKPSSCDQAGENCCFRGNNLAKTCDGGLTCDLGKTDKCFNLVPQADNETCNTRLGGRDCQSGNCDNGTCKPKPAPTASKCDSLGESCCFVAHNLPKTCDGGLTCVNDKCSDDCGTKGKQCCTTRGSPKGSCDKEPGLECSNNKCKTPGEEEDPPAAPTPPCAKRTASGECTEFASAFGNFKTDPAEFIRTVLGILLAASGAIALLLMMRAGYKIMMSQGKPETIQEGRDQLIAAIVGLLFLVFSFVFLQLIGVDILRVPGFGGVPGTIREKDSGLGNPKDAQCQTQNPDPVNERGDCAAGLTCNVDPSQCYDRGCIGTCQ